MAGKRRARPVNGELVFTLCFEILFMIGTALHSPKPRRRKCRTPGLCWQPEGANRKKRMDRCQAGPHRSQTTVITG